MGCMLTADGSGDDELCIQGLEEVQFSFELSDRHRNAKTGEMQEAASTDSDDSDDNSDEDMEQEVATVRLWNPVHLMHLVQMREALQMKRGRWCLSRHLKVFLSMMRCLLI